MHRQTEKRTPTNRQKTARPILKPGRDDRGVVSRTDTSRLTHTTYPSPNAARTRTQAPANLCPRNCCMWGVRHTHHEIPCAAGLRTINCRIRVVVARAVYHPGGWVPIQSGLYIFHCQGYVPIPRPKPIFREMGLRISRGGAAEPPPRDSSWARAQQNILGLLRSRWPVS